MFFKYTVKQNRSAQGTGKLPLAVFMPMKKAWWASRRASEPRSLQETCSGCHYLLFLNHPSDSTLTHNNPKAESWASPFQKSFSKRNCLTGNVLSY